MADSLRALASITPTRCSRCGELAAFTEDADGEPVGVCGCTVAAVRDQHGEDAARELRLRIDRTLRSAG